jgi:predicted amidohydrolase YtcJ
MSRTFMIHGRVYTQDKKKPWASAVAVDGGRIMAIGDDQEMRPMVGSDDEVIDHEGRLTMPAFTESHVHFYDWAMTRLKLPLGQTRTASELLEMVRQAATRFRSGVWITGRGFDETHWREGALPTRLELDTVAPDHPVFLYRRDMHLALANSMALKRAGIDEATPNPSEGVIDRDESGQPTGILRELAVNLVDDVVPEPTEDDHVEAMYDAMIELHKLGLTGLMDQRIMGGIDGLGAFRAWQRLRDLDRIPMRVWTNIPGERLDEVIALGLRTGFGDDCLRVGHVKFFSDGSVGARTAWLLDSYTDAESGMPLTPMEKIADGARKAEAAGLAVAIHAIGDRANREVIGLFEDLSKSRREGKDRVTSPPVAPHRIEHVQMIRPEDVKRLSGLGVVASVQPMHSLDDIPMAHQCLGDQCRWLYPFRDMLDSGITVAFGSDCPVSSPNPLLGIHAAVNRCHPGSKPSEALNPEQRITVAEAVWCYTMGPALVCGRDRELGSLTPGKMADLVVLDEDIFQIDPMEIHGVKPAMTVYDGRVIYSA